MLALTMLPIPSLQNAMVARLNQGEAGFLREQAEAAEAAARGAPGKCVFP